MELDRRGGDKAKDVPRSPLFVGETMKTKGSSPRIQQGNASSNSHSIPTRHAGGKSRLLIGSRSSIVSERRYRPLWTDSHWEVGDVGQQFVDGLAARREVRSVERDRCRLAGEEHLCIEHQVRCRCVVSSSLLDEHSCPWTEEMKSSFRRQRTVKDRERSQASLSFSRSSLSSRQHCGSHPVDRYAIEEILRQPAARVMFSRFKFA